MDRATVSPLCGSTPLAEVKDQKFYLTTAINYTNGPPHAGHAYEAVTSDVIARYHRIFGRDVFFLTGADAHGQKVEQSALKDGVTPQEIADRYANGFKSLNEKLGISNDAYILTTDAHHEELARKLWMRIRDNGDIYLKDYVGWYNMFEEQYVTDLEAESNDYKDEHGRPYEKKSEESYFFRMGKYKEPLLKHILENPEFIQPETRRNEILKFLEMDLNDLCISRTVCQWGITCPFDPEYTGDKSHVMYVWFDALINYLSGIHYESDESLARFWPANVHIIGKDIMRFHTIYWPTMLIAAGIELPKTVFGHGFVVAEDGVKMSKSLGNVIVPEDMISLYSADSLRYYMIRSCTFGNDIPFSESSLCSIFNVVFKDGLGNLLHRALSLCKAYSNGLVTSEKPYFENGRPPFELDVLRSLFECCFSTEPHKVQLTATSPAAIQLQKEKTGLQLQTAAEYVAYAVSDLNKYLQDAAPWAIKGKDEESVGKKNGIVRTVMEGIYILLHFLEPFTPHLIPAVFHKIGVSSTKISLLHSSFENIPSGTSTYVGDILCREFVPGVGEVEARSAAETAAAKEKAKQDVEKAKDAKKAKQQQSRGAVDQPLFSKIELKVGRIIKAWCHETAEKLYCEEVDIGEEHPRLIASGLREHYTLEEMQDRLVVVVSNLKPRKLAGFESNGMVVCATGEDKVEFLQPPEGSLIGERLQLEGLPNEFDPMAPNAVTKKKVFEEFAPLFSANGEGVAVFENNPVCSSAGPCTVGTLRNVPLK